MRNGKCPNCGGKLLEDTHYEYGAEKTFRVYCKECNLSTPYYLTIEFAWKVFEKKFGKPSLPLVATSSFYALGGPCRVTMIWRIQHGHYPEAVKHCGKWYLPGDIAEKTITEWKDIHNRVKQGFVVSLAETAEKCGLKRRSLNKRAKDLGARNFLGKWYLTKSQFDTLRSFYVDMVTTTKAAQMLNLSHRFFVLRLIKRGELKALKIGCETRISKREIESYLKGRV